MYDKLIVIGNLGSDPEMRYTADGKPVTNFSVAANRKWTGADGQAHEQVTVRYRDSASDWRTETLTFGPLAIQYRESTLGQPSRASLRGSTTEEMLENAKLTAGANSLPFLDGVVAWSYKSPSQILLYVPDGIEVEEKNDTTFIS